MESAGAPITVGIDARDAYAAHPRGVGKTLVDLLREVVETPGSSRLVLYRDEVGPGDQFAGRGSVREVVVRMRGYRFALWERVALPARALWDRLDVLHAPSPVVTRVFPVPFVVTVHDLIPLRVGDGWSAKSIERYRETCRRNIEAARVVIAVSETTKRDVVHEFGTDPEKVRVIYWAPRAEYRNVEPSTVARVTAGYGLASEYFLAFGGNAPRKNVAGIVEAYAKVRSDLRHRLALVLAGLPERSVGEVRELASRAGVSDRVHALGYVPEAELPALLAGSRAFLYLSLYEGFGLPLLEAMAARTAVVASDRSSIPEVAGDAALYADPLDLEAIARALERIAEDDACRADLVARGETRLREFTWKRAASGLLAAYRAARA